MPLAVVSEVVTGEAPVSYWPIFSLSLVTVQTSLRKLTWPSFFLRQQRRGPGAYLKTELTSRKTANLAPKVGFGPSRALSCSVLTLINLPIHPPERNTKAVVESRSLFRALRDDSKNGCEAD